MPSEYPSRSIPAVVTEEGFPDIEDDVPVQGHSRHAAYKAAGSQTQAYNRSACAAPEVLCGENNSETQGGSRGASFARDTTKRKSFLSVRDLRPADSETWVENVTNNKPVHPLHAWEQPEGRHERSTQQRGDEIRAGRDVRGGGKRGLGQRSKAGWNDSVGVPWSEAELRGKGSRQIPPIGGWGGSHREDRMADTDPLRLFKASTKGVGVPLRRAAQGHMHGEQAPMLGKRGRDRGFTDVPSKVRTACPNRTQGINTSAAHKNKFTVRRAGGLRKGKGGWSLQRQPNVGDFAGDPILEGESTVLSAGEEESGCESERDTEFGSADVGFLSEDHDADGAVLWEEHDAVRAAAHALHARGEAPSPGDAVDILEAQLREAVQAAEAECSENNRSDGALLVPFRHA